MDLKGITKQLIQPVGPSKKDPIEKTIRSENTQERDGNGQQAFGEGQKHQDMSEEQFQKAVEHLRSHAIVKEQNLEVTVEMINGHRWVYISEPSGKVVRRIQEFELHSLQFSKDNEKGQLLSKSA